MPKISPKMIKNSAPKLVKNVLTLLDIYQEEKGLMKCDRCGCEMELDAYILREMAEADGEDKLSCICMECGRGTMHEVKK